MDDQHKDKLIKNMQVKLRFLQRDLWKSVRCANIRIKFLQNDLDRLITSEEVNEDGTTKTNGPKGSFDGSR